MRKKIVPAVVAVLAVVAALSVWRIMTQSPAKSGPSAAGTEEEIAATPPAADASDGSPVPSASSGGADGDGQAEASDAAEDSDTDRAPSEEDRRAAEEERLVNEFDALTDRWMEASGKEATMADVDAFVAQFKSIPDARREECLQRALNLIPDEHVMLLAGILMDKSQPKELVELVFNDILNRDESVKAPILKRVFGDRTHPCWADAAWILDVTGEKSE